MPLDVILIIMSVLFACSVMHVAGGMDYMVRVASRVLRANPKYINILAPAIAFLLTILSGTGFTTMSILNVIQEVAKQNGVRPSQPLTSAVVASQIAISASPISAATAAMWVVVETMGVSFGQVLCVILPAGLFGAAVASLISAFQGVDLEKDPIFQARMKAGLVAMSSQEQRDAPLPKGAKLSVVIFLLSVVFIVAMLLFKKEIGHTLGSRDIIVITMLFISMLMYWFCDVELTKIKNSSIFKGGYESLVVILGICWLASTVIGIYIPTIKEQATVTPRPVPGPPRPRLLLRVRSALLAGCHLGPARPGCRQPRLRRPDDPRLLRGRLGHLRHERLPDLRLRHLLRRHGLLHGQVVRHVRDQPSVLPPGLPWPRRRHPVRLPHGRPRVLTRGFEQRNPSLKRAFTFGRTPVFVSANACFLTSSLPSV